MTIHNKCLICGFSNLNHLKKYRKAYLVKCQYCNFVFSKKIPQEKELHTHYAKYPRNDNISTLTKKRYHTLLNILEKYRKTNKILDIGCGNGHFLTVAKERGWNVFGTEFTNQAVEICQSKGITCYQGALVNLNIQETFDVITSFEVIEHINNQTEELAIMQSLLRPKGAIYLTTPNFNSISRYILKSKWRVIEYPEHLAYFTPKTLNQLFLKFNFNNKILQTTGIEVNEIMDKFLGKNKPTLDRYQQKENIRETFENKKNRFLKLTIR